MIDAIDTSSRLLRLLAILQSARVLTGPDLARRLGVSTRTIRADVERLRQLGYPVVGERGLAGGYRLGSGAQMPPLALDDEEAVAVAVGLRHAAVGGVEGIEETSERALAKLEQVLPSRLRRRVQALQAYAVSIPLDGPRVDPEVLATLAGVCRDHERLRFDYRRHDGSATRRTVEPHRLVSYGRRWYLVAWDCDRSDWRTFRVDRIEPRVPTGPRFSPRELPEPDVAAFVAKGVDLATWKYHARVRVHAPAAAVSARVPASVQVEAVDDTTCIASVGGDDPAVLALYLGLLDADFDVLEGPELVDRLRQLADRFARAAASDRGGSDS